MRWLWLGGAVILAVAAAAVWFAFQRPEFVAGIVGIAAVALWTALARAIAMRKADAEEAIWRDAIREGMAATDQRRGDGPSSK